MTDKKPAKRRPVSKLRLYKALKQEVMSGQVSPEMTLNDFMDTLKDDVMDELTAE